MPEHAEAALPKVFQLIGSALFGLGLILALYTLLGQVLAVVAPEFVKTEPSYTEALGSFIFNRPARAFLLAAGLTGVGGLIFRRALRAARRG